jgi:hypothetical protein
MKKLLLIILIATAIVISFSAILDSVSGFSLYFGETLLSPIQAMIGAIVAGAAFMLIGGLLAISLLSVLFIVLATVFIALLVAGISAVWPALLLVLVIYLVVRDKKPLQGC